MDTKSGPPPSCARWTDPLLIAATAAVSYALCRDSGLNNTGIAFVASAAVAIVMGATEIIHAPWRKSPRPRIAFKITLKNAGVKFMGVMAGFALTLLFWNALPEYANAGYGVFFRVLATLLPFVPIVVAAAVLFTEWRLGPEEDSAWHTGMLLLGQWKRIKLASVRSGLLGWLVRGIFLPLNFSALVTFIGRFRGHEAEIFSAPWQQAEFYLLMMISAALAAAIVPGYLFSSRLLGTHIRKVDFTLTGWLVTLSCYPPLMRVVFTQGLNFYPHMDRVSWGAPWAVELDGFPALVFAVGILVLLLEGLHYWGEAVFGLRASNLSHRGIITNGPYRFCKHPIYLVKCIIWLLWMPFLAGGSALECAYLTLLWAGVCSIYFMRAWVEERLLCGDPAYAAYALWMDRHGMFSRFGRLCPFLRFEWRLRRWAS